MPKELFDDARESWTYTDYGSITTTVAAGGAVLPIEPREVTVDNALSLAWGAETGNVSIGSINKSLPENNGWFLDLDRETINRLIKALRRARDTVFGADE